MLSLYLSDTATPAIYTLSLHDALPILAPPVSGPRRTSPHDGNRSEEMLAANLEPAHKVVNESAASDRFLALICAEDRKSTRLNSSHLGISYAVFCLKKKKNKNNI